MSLGNTDLVQYGIQNEKSDLRVHVCPLIKRVYVYLTHNGVEAIEKGNYRQAPAYQQGIETARGYLVPPLDIDGCISLVVPEDIWVKYNFSSYDALSIKGRKALDLTQELVNLGRLPIPVQSQEVSDRRMQIEGKDMLVSIDGNVKIQVKCDYRGGERNLGGTGNLYLQIAECNPFGIH